MNPYMIFLVCLVVGAPVSLVGMIALIFELAILDLPGFLYASFALATLATAGMICVIFGGERYVLVLVFGPYCALFLPFFFLAAGRIGAGLAARAQESKVPVKPFAAALVAERKRNLREAARLYEEYLDGAGDDSEALGHYAACLVKLARFDEAVEAHRQAFKLLKGARQIDAGLEVAYILEVKKGDAEAAQAQIEHLRRSCFNTGLEEVLERKIQALRVRITSDPRPFEEKIDLAGNPHPHILD